VGVVIQVRMSEDASIWRDVLAKSTAVEVIVEKLKDIIRSILQDLPSDSKNHAAKYLDVFLSFKASLHCSIIPKRTPLSPIASLRANVDPRSFSTSTRTTA